VLVKHGFRYAPRLQTTRTLLSNTCRWKHHGIQQLLCLSFKACTLYKLPNSSLLLMQCLETNTLCQ
jgi:hypothetical protein